MKPLEVAEEACVAVVSDADIVAARMRGRALAIQLGFSVTEATLIATAISELARNIILYAGCGDITIAPIQQGDRTGLVVVARDEGPGIPDAKQAMQDGYSTSGRLGLGLPGVRRLMDDFEIVTRNGDGTTVRAKKWNS